MGANTKFKDSVFSFLFSDPDLLRELYCALENVDIPSDVPVIINTLQDVLFMDQINDISFEIGNKLVILIEHQSTINPNMALRLLVYIGRIYEKIIEKKKVYSTKRFPIPRPEFYVLYNGKSPYPDETILKLSDAFESGLALGLPEKAGPALELTVKVININQGRNEAIGQRCKTLAGYSRFVGKVQEYERANAGREEAIKAAVKYCVEHEILKEFFEENATEVMNMLISEWNTEEAKQVWYEEGKEEGWTEGMETAARNAFAQGASLEFVQKITGLDLEVLQNIRSDTV